MYGHGAHLSFGRNANGEDVKLITADHMLADDRDDIVADFNAYKMTPTLVWFNGGTSFLAQTLAVRGSLNAKIYPFKPMANGMVFDARFFDGDYINNADRYLTMLIPCIVFLPILITKNVMICIRFAAMQRFLPD